MRTSMKIAGAALVVAAAVWAPMKAAAQDQGEFFKGKTIRVLVGFPPGGSYDFYARLAADMLKASIPGLEAAIVENKPGAGGLVATSFLYSQGSKDGLTLAVPPDTIGNTQLLDPANAKWDIAKFNFIGSFVPANSVMMRRGDAPAKTIEEMKTTESNVGCSGKNAQSYQFAAMMKALGGLNFKMICGYRGNEGYSIALERGELDMVSSSWSTWRVTHKEQLASGKVVPVFQVGLKRDAELPNVPLMQDILTDPEAKAAAEFVSSGTALGRALVAPPEVPAARVAFLRATFDRMVQDSAMKAMAAKRNLLLAPSPGAEIQKLAERIIATPKPVVEKAAKAFQ